MNTNTPFLSIIIPVYNGAKYLERTISTIIKQPLDDYEVIFIDDGSKDNSAEICEEYTKDARFRLIRQENHGVAYTRNRGIKESRGDIIIFHDQDDLFVENFYTEATREKIKGYLEQQVDVIRTGRYVTWDLKEYKFQEVEEKLVDSDAAISWEIGYEFNSYIFSGKFLRDREVYFWQFKVDLEEFYRHKTLYLARKVLYSNDLVFQIRYRNEDSVSSRWDKKWVCGLRIKAHRTVLKWHKAEHPEDKEVIRLTKKSRRQIIRNYIWYCTHAYE